MCGPALTLCLLLWSVGPAVSRTQGQVTAPASLSAEVGHSLLLGCNVTTETGDTVRQVRWLDRYKKVLLAYEQGVPVRISHQDPNVLLTATNNDASYITIKRVRPDDEGCYRCIFDVYPRGPLEGTTCISVTGKVRLEGNKTAVSGKPVTLSCWYSLSERVRQVLWRKTAEQGDTTKVASFATNGHQSTQEQYRGRVSLSQTLGDTQLTIKAVRTEDEGCYTCEFHTYPDGTKSDVACLSVYVLPNPEVSHVTSSSGVTEANCTAQSRPAAEIMWNIGGDNRTLGPPIISAYDQGDGTTLVTSTLLFPSALLSELSVKCVVHHPGLEKPMNVSLNTSNLDGAMLEINVRNPWEKTSQMEYEGNVNQTQSCVGPAVVILLSVCGVAAVLLLCLCVCLCKCFICTGD